MLFSGESMDEVRALSEKMQGIIKQMGALSDPEVRENLRSILALEQHLHEIAIRLQELRLDK